MEKKFIVRKIMIGRESQYMYKGEYGYSFGYGITYPREIEMFDTKKQTWRARGRLPAAYKNQGGTSILKIYGNESSDVFLINRRLFIFKI